MRDETANAAADAIGGDLQSEVTADAGQDANGGHLAAVASGSVIDDAEATLADVEAALERLESGEYGICEICNAAIEPSILERSPLKRRCGLHSS